MLYREGDWARAQGLRPYLYLFAHPVRGCVRLTAHVPEADDRS